MMHGVHTRATHTRQMQIMTLLPHVAIVHGPATTLVVQLRAAGIGIDPLDVTVFLAAF